MTAKPGAGGDARSAFVAAFGGIYERSPWVAERVHDEEPEAAGSAARLAAAMRRTVDAAGEDRQLALLRAHPDLAGRLAVRGALTDASADEQASAGLDACSPAEFEAFRSLNDRYREKFGFPFVLAVRGRDRAGILEVFRRRIGNDPASEFAEALGQVHRIAELRLEAAFRDRPGVTDGN